MTNTALAAQLNIDAATITPDAHRIINTVLGPIGRHARLTATERDTALAIIALN
ncbi:hypothetical protein SEA_AFFECA_8 [Gordonia phage Affeca]|uniref:Helix-turn-helix DNA binding protein n=3 Tax=Vividuovirus TaxID=2560251 RepID=A0A4Y6EL29_9CAUD|nr:hypothetical protein KNU19_gp06 [Gordonia phage Fosterous]YP_010102837.1 helix-turn-helix DNA binding protein [Gordonia phage Galadriel]YP_010103298.1 helix-turn-helix DNA binding protein [Gordonia phage McKinley]AYR02391.1 hypothetical protein SEA_AFFECA_8 [Gordonia phage Affeca]QXN73668.1 helix-turn-helix DNA binding domain protein [Gordonia phage Fitzgerald]UVF60694.1 helix-turn-helix DNA binding domain protein [Gordonia phage BobBob]AYR02727.1 hypothetical protein SEA_FOSTEROUS_6 [Gord